MLHLSFSRTQDSKISQKVSFLLVIEFVLIFEPHNSIWNSMRLKYILIFTYNHLHLLLLKLAIFTMQNDNFKKSQFPPWAFLTRNYA